MGFYNMVRWRGGWMGGKEILSRWDSFSRGTVERIVIVVLLESNMLGLKLWVICL